MPRRVNPHRRLKRRLADNLLIHLEKITVPLHQHLFTQTPKRFRKIKVDTLPRRPHTIACIATLFRSTRSHVARHKVTKGRITPLEVIVALLLRDLRRFARVALLLRYPNTPVVTQRLTHEGQLALKLIEHRQPRRVYLYKARVGKECPLAVRGHCRRTIAIEREG